MTPERAQELVARWVRFYTRELPTPIAQRRIDEIEADLHDHIAHERERGTPDARIARGIAGRMLRGAPADLSWGGRATPRGARSPVVRAAVVTAVLLLFPLVATPTSGSWDWGVFDFVFAGAIIAGAGLLIELVVRSRGPAAYAAAAVAGTLGVAAMVAGEADDAPGLVGFGLLLLLSMVALTARNVQRSQ